jgi:hypothetical protein
MTANHQFRSFAPGSRRAAANDPIADIGTACQTTVMTDDDEARFDERMLKIVKHKPVEKPE